MRVKDEGEYVRRRGVVCGSERGDLKVGECVGSLKRGRGKECWSGSESV